MTISKIVAVRYLKTSKENRFFSWITFLSMGGVSLGVAALIVVLSVIDGFEFELRNLFMRANAHIMAFKYPGGLTKPDKWEEAILKAFKKDITSISPFIHYETMVKNGSLVQNALIRGMNPLKREKVQTLKDVVSPYKSLEYLQKEVLQNSKNQTLPVVPSVVLGSGLLSLLDAKIGDTVKLISASKDLKHTKLSPFKVVGVYNSGLKHYDNKIIFMSLPVARKFFNMDKNTVTGLEIGLKDANKSTELAKQMKEKYNISFREWKSFNRPIFEAMKTEKTMISLLVAIVMIVATFNILTTIFISVSEKQKDISVLRSIGATQNQIIGIFLYQGALIGVIGSIAGSILALIISVFLENVPILDLPDPYFLKNLPVYYSPMVYISVCSFSVFMCIIAGLYPAWVGSKVKPAAGFRGTFDAI